MIGVLGAQFGGDLRQLLRDPTAVGFTIGFPIVFLFIFVSIFGNETIDAHGQQVEGVDYYVPGISTMAIVGATFVNLTITVTGDRERGVLKRVQATPLPPLVFIASRLLVAIATALAMTVLLVAVGAIVYGAQLPTETLPGALLAVIVGAAALSALGLALTAATPTEQAAPPMANLIALPIEFFSGVFIPKGDIPSWMLDGADVLPVKPLFDALLKAFDPTTTGVGIDAGALLVLLAWCVAGLLLAARFFTWAPRGR